MSVVDHKGDTPLVSQYVLQVFLGLGDSHTSDRSSDFECVFVMNADVGGTGFNRGFRDFRVSRILFYHFNSV